MSSMTTDVKRSQADEPDDPPSQRAGPPMRSEPAEVPAIAPADVPRDLYQRRRDIAQ